MMMSMKNRKSMNESRIVHNIVSFSTKAGELKEAFRHRKKAKHILYINKIDTEAMRRDTEMSFS